MHPIVIRRDLPPTGPVSPAPLPSAGKRSPSRCRVHKCGGGSAFHDQITHLLRFRLKIVAGLFLFPLLAFMATNLILIALDGLPQMAGSLLVVQAAVAAGTAVVAALLWLRPHLGRCGLRGVELGIFGLGALFFCWMQVTEQDQFRRMLTGDCRQCDVDALRDVIFKTALGWFLLLIPYGVFIPNTWRRCAAVVGGMGLIPVALLALDVARTEKLWHFDILILLGQLAILMATAAGIAIFGSYRIHALQEKAFEAQQLGQYRLQRRLGAGGMGEVYLAEHVLLRRPCAIKLIRADQAGDPTSLQRFEREVRAMATLTHWNTVEVFDYGHNDDGTFYYVMEYLPGRNLEALVQRHGPLPPGRAVYLLRQVCRALREAHGIGLLHRDIKPSNVMACPRGGVYDVAKLLDFGLVQSAVRGLDARLTMQGAIVGSPPYMSPEQAAGKEVDERSDIYSLGAVAYYLLTGQPPFQRDTPMQTLLAHAYEPVPPLARPDGGAPEDLAAVVLRCLEKDPGRRFQDADGLEKALAACACAAEWTEEDARKWWLHEAKASDTAESAALDAPTAAL